MRTTSANERPAGFEQRADVVEDAPRLRRDVAVDDAAGRGIDRNLARHEQQLPGANGRRVRADRLRRCGLEIASLMIFRQRTKRTIGSGSCDGTYAAFDDLSASAGSACRRECA